MSWDEKAQAYADTLNAGVAAMEGDFTYSSSELADMNSSNVVIGSAWQREALRSEESVEKGARAAWEHEQAKLPRWTRTPWSWVTENDGATAERYRGKARAVLAAALGAEA